MPRKPQPRDYRHNRKWLEIIKYQPKPKPETVTDRVRHELEETERMSIKTVTPQEVQGIVSQLHSFIADEDGAIAEYSKLRELFKRISMTTGMLEHETRDIERILSEEKNHGKILQMILSKLTMA